ncbi:hypothetical protein N0V82_009307 [Gnomoniopsis sp. IMI 355080]|nr:hypothetical protein N0V82_009307 [Gnomoniopsis sp. IMI 355080]
MLLNKILLLAGTALATPTWPEKLDTRTTMSVDGTLYCGIFASGDRTTASGLLTDLDAGANGKVAHSSFTIPSGGCERVHCWDTTGIYACNDDSKAITLSGNDIWAVVNHVFKICCQEIVDMFGATGPGLSGQKFIRGTGENWNAVIAYGNCRSSNTIKPSDAGGWNVNPVCEGGDSNPYDS